MDTRVDYKWLKQKEIWEEEKSCMRCSVLFTELGNIGKWECKYHPGSKVEVPGQHYIRTAVTHVRVPQYRWSCCNRLWSSNHEDGCKSCDHTDWRLVMDAQDTLEDIPRTWLQTLRPLKDAVIAGSADSPSVNIKRIQ